MQSNGRFVKIHIELRNIRLGPVTPDVTLKKLYYPITYY